MSDKHRIEEGDTELEKSKPTEGMKWSKGNELHCPLGQTRNECVVRQEVGCEKCEPILAKTYDVGDTAGQITVLEKVGVWLMGRPLESFWDIHATELKVLRAKQKGGEE